jgi:hypothetical protein
MAVEYSVPEFRLDGTKNGTPLAKDISGANHWEIVWRHTEGWLHVETHEIPITHPPILEGDGPIKYETRAYNRRAEIRDTVYLPPERSSELHVQLAAEERRKVAETWFTEAPRDVVGRNRVTIPQLRGVLSNSAEE